MSYLAATLIWCVYWPVFIFVFLASIATLWWPNIWPKMGYPELPFLAFILNLIHCSLLGWVSWPMFIFVFLQSIVALWCVIFARKGVVRIVLPHDPTVGKTIVGIFLIRSFLEGFSPVRYPQWLQYRNICWIFLDKAGVYCSHLWAQLVHDYVTRNKNIIKFHPSVLNPAHTNNFSRVKMSCSIISIHC